MERNSAGSRYIASHPPGIIVQTDAFPASNASVVVCQMTSDCSDAPDFRVTVENVLKPHLKSTVLTLISKGISQREIHRLTGIDRKTIRFYAKSVPTEAATGSIPVLEVQNPPPRPPAFPAEEPGAPIVARSACEPHRGWIEAQLRLERNAMAIYQELVDTRGFIQACNSVKRFCRALPAPGAGAVRPTRICSGRRMSS